MGFSFRPAKREQVGLIVGVGGSSGSGKTYSSLRLATGITEFFFPKKDKRFAFIGTENRRGLHYAKDFSFDYGELRAPFKPGSYLEAIMAADKAKYPVIVVDSFSHAWAGDGGVLDWQEAEYVRMGNKESNRLRSWAAPKQGHKKMVTGLLSVRAFLILCFRAEPKVEMVKRDGKMQVVAKESPVGYEGWMPICEKGLPYELTVSFMLMADNPGMPKPIKLEEQHRALFPLDKKLDEEAGRRIVEWASGGDPRPAAPAAAPVQTAPPEQPPAAEPTGGPGLVTAQHLEEVAEWMRATGLNNSDVRELCKNTLGRRVDSSKTLTLEEFTKLRMKFDGVKSGQLVLLKDPPRFEEAPSPSPAAADGAPMDPQGDIPF